MTRPRSRTTWLDWLVRWSCLVRRVAATLRATAFPSNDASGTAQATGTLAIDMVAGYRDDGTLARANTITSLAITPNPASVAVGSSLTLTATATNSNGQPVTLGSSNAITWPVTAGGSNLSRDSSTGSTTQVTGVASGPATVRATERESGRSGTLTVVVPRQGGDVGVVVQ
ncbi:MAG: hypothetical protein IT204_10405 [Fimbriimonadaceae bacterium]|nr:hypothetical protein [Fimbriimonadaceae bacterium]